MIVAQLTDPHLSESAPEAAERFALALAHLLRLPSRPDVLLVTGDLAEHGAPAEYARCRELLAALPLPAYVVPGNHDDRTGLRAAFGPQGRHAMDAYVQYVVDAGPLRLVALDTAIPRENPGELCAERLKWLEARLAEAPARPTIVFMHHPPFRIGLHALDAMGLREPEALGRLIERHPQVERLLAGHVHCALARRFHGTIAMTAVATASRIDLDLSRPDCVALVEGPPEILLHAWDDAAGLRSFSCVVGEPGARQVVYDGADWLPA
jgi:3',5'-cyclic AMP phosphodiesterase CpdA